MDNVERQREIERLNAEAARLKAWGRQLTEELFELVAQVPETRRKFGNAFYYSHPEEPDEGIGNYRPTPPSESGLRTMREVTRVARELERITAELRRLGG